MPLNLGMVLVLLTIQLIKIKKESGTEIGHSLEFDFVVPPPHS